MLPKLLLWPHESCLEWYSIELATWNRWNQMMKYISRNHRFWISAWLFFISLILTLFMEQDYFSCKATEILTVSSLNDLFPSLPCVSFCLCFLLFLPFLFRALHVWLLFCWEDYRIVYFVLTLKCSTWIPVSLDVLWECYASEFQGNFFSPLSAPFFQQPCKIAHCFAFLKHSNVYRI